MHYVYLLGSKSHPREQYVGSTIDLKKRFLDQNRGHSPPTAKFAASNVRSLALRQPRLRGFEVARDQSMTGRFELPGDVCACFPQHRGEALGIFDWHNGILLA